jgi:hypothetical protein
MTTNVPQDVVEFEGGKYRLELTEEGYKAFRYGEPWVAANGSKLIGIMATEIAQLRAQRQQGAEPVGDWVMVPEDATNEIICAIEREVQSQCTASGVSEPLHRLDGQYIYAAMLSAAPTPPQANALVAAAYGDAREAWIYDDNLSVIVCKGRPFNSTRYRQVWIVESLHSPADAEAALRERDFAMCMKAAVEAYIAGQEHGRHGKTADLDAIVNSVLGEGGK